MPKLVELPTGQLAEFPDEMGDDEILSVLREKFPPTQDPYANDSAWDFSGERTLAGRFLEGNKAVPRGFANTILSSVEGAAELVDAATNFVGLDNLIDSGDENAVVWAANAGKDWLNNKSGLKADPRYQDLWTTKFGEGVGSMASFFTPTVVLKGASVLNRGRVALEGVETLGKMTRAEKIATGAFAASSGAGEAAQRAKAAREEGLDVSEGQEDFATAQGAIVGLSEMLPISRILGRVPKNISRGEKDYLVNLFKSAGIAAAEEGGQEVSAAILQNMIERGYNPNQEILEESLMDDLTVGGAVGALADITLNAFAGRRKGYMTEAQKENERKAREIEARNDFQFRQEMTERKRIADMIQSDPEAFQAEADRVQGLANTVPVPTNEEVMSFNQPSVAGAVATPETLGELYSLRIVGKLGSFFPTNTSFTVEQGEDVPTPAVGPDGTETVVPQPSFKVVDSTGKQYGQTLNNPDVASSLARNLNGEIVGQSVRGSILNTLMTSPQGYNPEQATNLFRYGYQTLNPESNNVTYAALNDAAGTTTENGYIEEVSHNDILKAPKKLYAPGKVGYEVTMPNGKKRIAVGLTASQELNRKREDAGLPPVNSFNIRQAREALGGNIGTLGNPSVTGIQDQLKYAPVDVGGKPAVMSQAREVLTKRKTTLAEKAKAGFKQDGTSVLPDYIEFQSMEDAKQYADSLNKRKADKRFIPDALFEGKKDLFPEIKTLLEAKNIDAKLESDEVSQFVKAFTGAKDAKSMSLEDQKLFYARLRNLPGFSTKTKLPVFRLRPYSPEQFVKATKYQQQNPGAVTDEGLASVLGLDPASPKVAAIKSDLQKQTDARLQKEVLRDSRLPLVEGLRKALDDYGLSSVTLRLEESLKGPDGGINEGFFDRQMDEIALAIDGIDPEASGTDEQRLNYLKEVLSHEVVHALRALDLWTAKEWDILSNAAARTIRPDTGETFIAFARRLYPEESVETQIEESVAELARAYIANKKLIGGKPRNLLERMIRLFQRLKAFVTNSGYQSFEAILNDMRSGAIGARDRGEIRSLRLTKNVPEGYVVADNVPEGVEARTVQDFDEAALEGAEVMQSRKEVRYSRKPMESSKDWAYSPLMKAVEQASSKITTAQQWSQWLDANASKLGVTKDEIDFSGIKDFLALKDGKVSKEDINGYLNNNGAVVKDIIKANSPEAKQQVISDYIENYIENEPRRFVNGYVIQYPDGSVGVYSDNKEPIEGSPSFVADRVGIDPDAIDFPRETKYGAYTLPGGENYRELLLTLPKDLQSSYEIIENPNNSDFFAEDRFLVIDAFGNVVDKGNSKEDATYNYIYAKSYFSPHWDGVPSILAHIRMDDRFDQNGDKVLFVGEFQSDWGQKGRKEGFGVQKLDMYEGPVEPFYPPKEGMLEYRFRDEDGNAYSGYGYTEKEARNDVYKSISSLKKTQEGPFVTKTENWTALAIKRVLALAANEGYSKVAFINGEQAAELYDLSNHVSVIEVIKKPDVKTVTIRPRAGVADVGGFDINSDGLIIESYGTDFTGKHLSDVIGKEMAEKIMDSKESVVFKGLDLKVGGQGMKGYYNNIVPQVAKKVIKDVGGKNLSEINVLDTGMQTGIEITPEMATRIAAGQRLFSRKDIPNIDLSRLNEVRASLPATIDVNGVQRPTTNSRGMPIFLGNDKISAEQGIRNFWRWFGNSKMVDKKGRPIPVYHATQADFEAFGNDFRELGWHFGIVPEQGEQRVENRGWDHEVPLERISPQYAMSIAGIEKDKRNEYWTGLSEEERIALLEDARPTIPRFKNGANVMPVYLRMENPVNVGLDAENWGKKVNLRPLLSGKGKGKPFTSEEFNKFQTPSEVRNALIEKGYDGILYDNMYEGGYDIRPEAFMVFRGFQIKSAIGNVGRFSKATSKINYSRKDLQGEPKIPFEVAPSPDNTERTAAWRMVPHADKVRITQSLGPKAVREASKILGIDTAAFEPIISGQGLFEGHVNPNQILGIRQQFMGPDEVLEFASVLGRILEQKAMIAADGRMTGRETSVIRIKTNVSSPKVADRIYAALTAELGDLGGYTAYKNHMDVFNFTSTDSETLAGRFVELLKTNTPDINARVSHDTIQSAYLEKETYGDYLRRKKSANQERLERGIESARSRIIGELETSISRAGQRSDEQSRVRGLAPGEGRDTDTDGRTGPAKSLEEVKGPDWLPIPKLENAESIPVFAQSKPKKDSVSAFVAHYSNAQGLMSLDGAFAGTGSAGREARRFGLGNYGKKAPPGSLARRLYFYVQSKDALPKKERVVAGNSIYRVRLDNLYDAYNDPRGFSDEAGMNADYFEELVSDAGFDGAVYTEQPGIDEPTVVLFGLKKKVPVRAYNEPEAEQPVAPISEEQAAEAVAKAKKDTELTPKTAVPLYGENASPDALFVAQNPESGAKLGTKGKKKYSRRGNEPTYSPAAQVLIDQTPQAPNETMGETLVNTMKLGPLRDGVDIFRQAIVFKGARLERQYKENPELARLMADSSALTAYEMMDHSRSMTQAALTNGVPVYVNGGFKVVPFVHKGKTIERGFLEVMAPLNNDKLHGNLERLAHRYAMAVRGERLNAEGKLTPVAPGELAILKAEIQKYRNPETGRPVIEEWYEMWQDYNSYIVKFLRDTGVVDESGAELWLKQADYVPFYREDNQGNLVHPKVFGGLHTASQFKSVGKSSEDLNIDMVTAIVNNIDAAIAMGMKNVAQQRVIRDQINIGLASILKKGETVGDRNSVSFKIAGKRYTAIIEDPLIYQSMLPSNEIGMDNLFGKMLRIPASILRELIIRDPGYMVANMFRDTLSTYVTTGAEVVPLWGTAKGFAGDIQKLRNLGVLGGYDLRLDKFGVRKFYDKEAKRMGMVAGLNWINPISTAWDLMGRISERSEAATRLAVYEDVLKRTGNQVEAQYQALSVMNYGRRGNNALFRALTAVVPFLNARVQGLDKLYQAGTGRVGAQYKTDTAGNVIPDAQRRKNFARFVYRAGIITAVSAMYYAMVSDDDEYLNASPEIRDNYYILPIMKGDIESGKPGLSARLPIPFEVGILFKVIPERLLAGIYGDDTSKDFKDSMKRALVSTLGINPTPQAVLPIAEALVNKDFYSGRPIVPTYMENLLPEQQKTFYTNQLAESVANSIGASPMKIQHLMQGYGGTLGGYFLQAIDSMARENEMVLPSTQWFQKPFIKRFFTTANQPGLQNKFYELKDDVDGMTQTINRLQKDGRYDELAAFYAKNGHMYEMRTDLNYLEKQITMLREQRKVIEQMDIDPESKREAIEQINMMISATLISVPMYRQMAYDKE